MHRNLTDENKADSVIEEGLHSMWDIPSERDVHHPQPERLQAISQDLIEDLFKDDPSLISFQSNTAIAFEENKIPESNDNDIFRDEFPAREEQPAFSL